VVILGSWIGGMKMLNFEFDPEKNLIVFLKISFNHAFDNVQFIFQLNKIDDRSFPLVKKIICSCQWGSLLPGLCMLDRPLDPIDMSK
jgi:hypothetical protein